MFIAERCWPELVHRVPDPHPRAKAKCHLAFPQVTGDITTSGPGEAAGVGQDDDMLLSSRSSCLCYLKEETSRNRNKSIYLDSGL